MADLFAIADLHLAFGVPDKRMGNKWDCWLNHEEKLFDHWTSLVKQEDIILIPGDISWALSLEEAKKDFEELAKLPGKKILLKGNHDYWWPSNKKLTEFLATFSSSFYFINNNSLLIDGISIGGSRLWENNELHFNEIINFVPGPSKNREITDKDIECFNREINRLENSLKNMQKGALRIALTHYPPIENSLHPSRFSLLFERYEIDHVIFGHIHNAKKEPLFGMKNGVNYHLVAADYLDFCPKKIASFPL